MRTLLTILLLCSVSPVAAQERGVYIGYSDSVLQVVNNQPTIVDDIMQRLAASDVTHVWTTNGPDTYDRILAWTTAANRHGIKCRIGSGYWYINGVLDDPVTKFNRINNLWVSLPPANRPLSFVIGDETVPEARSLTAELASRCRAAGIATTYTVLHKDYNLFVSTVGSYSSYTACDYYPFFAPGLITNPPYGNAALTTFSSVFQQKLLPSQQNGTKPLAIVQGFQDWSGPARLASNGNLVTLPGSQQLFRAPTAKEISWQIYDAATTVGHGVYVFAYGLGGPSWTPDPLAPPSNNMYLSPPATTTTDTGAPSTLVSFPSYTDGPGMVALRTAYAKLKQTDGLLPNLVDAAKQPVIVTPMAGDRARLKVDSQTGKRHLFLIADPRASTRLMVIQQLPLAWYTGTKGFFFYGTMYVSIDGGDMLYWRLD